MPASISPNAVTWFRVVATAEALSWAGLLLGMFFKYVVVHDEIGVQVFGPIHGGVFVAYVVSVLVLFRRFGWSRRVTVLALAASVPPFATYAFEVWAQRSGRLSVREGRRDEVLARI